MLFKKIKYDMHEFKSLLTRALEGGALLCPPHMFFENSEKTAARSAAVFVLHLCQLNSGSFGTKKSKIGWKIFELYDFENKMADLTEA